MVLPEPFWRRGLDHPDPDFRQLRVVQEFIVSLREGRCQVQADVVTMVTNAKFRTTLSAPESAHARVMALPCRLAGG